MGQIYDELERLFGDRAGEGLNTLDFVRLPIPVRGIVQLMLRHQGEMTYPALSEAMSRMPEDKRLSQAELDEALDAMHRLNMLDRTERGKVIAYRLNLGDTSSGQRPQPRPGSARPAQDASSAGEPGEGGGFVSRVLDTLGLKLRRDG